MKKYIQLFGLTTILLVVVWSTIWIPLSKPKKTLNKTEELKLYYAIGFSTGVACMKRGNALQCNEWLENFKQDKTPNILPGMKK